MKFFVVAKHWLGIILVGLLFIIAFSITRVHPEPVHLGWQTPWATQGQLVMGLKHTNIPELVGIGLDFFGFAHQHLPQWPTPAAACVKQLP